VSLLEVRDLSVQFGRNRVVDGVSFSIDIGEKVAIVGESGSGKTVTALALLRLTEGADVSGRIDFDGRDVFQMSPSALRELRPDIVLILPWNIADELVGAHGYVKEWGGEFVTAIPELRVIRNP